MAGTDAAICELLHGRNPDPAPPAEDGIPQARRGATEPPSGDLRHALRDGVGGQHDRPCLGATVSSYG